METAATDVQPLQPVIDFLVLGGPAIWAIIGLSILTLAVVLWKVVSLSMLGVWSQAQAKDAVEAWVAGDQAASKRIENEKPALAQVVRTAIATRINGMPDGDAREETSRVARNLLSRTRGGLRTLELIATIAPLIGLLGTVLGMIEAFQALETSGSRADPAALAGGIWEALLTTAAGMAVAIPASAALTWFESVADRVRLDMEDAATRILTRPNPDPALHAVPEAVNA